MQINHSLLLRNDKPNRQPEPPKPLVGGRSSAGFWLRASVIMLLCGQNSLYTLLRRYSQGILKEKATPSSILWTGEVIKLLWSGAMIFYGSKSTAAPLGASWRGKLRFVLGCSLPMAVPAVTYLAMNLLSYVALQRIDAGLFTVYAQCKLLTTALFSVLLMGKTLQPRKWRALLLMVFGTVLISNQTKPISWALLTDQHSTAFVIGTAAVVTEVTLSGFISVYFEHILKARVNMMQAPPSVWDRNAQLALYSLLLYTPITWFEAGPGGIYDGWSEVTWAIAFLGSAGGVLVALCMKYTDAIIKGMATSGSIIITTVVGGLYLDAPYNLVIFIGSATVILALFGYNDDGEIPAPLAVNSSPEPIMQMKSVSVDTGYEQGMRRLAEAEPTKQWPQRYDSLGNLAEEMNEEYEDASLTNGFTKSRNYMV